MRFLYAMFWRLLSGMWGDVCAEVRNLQKMDFSTKISD